MPNFSVHGPYLVRPAKTSRGNDTFIVDPDHAPHNLEQFEKYGCYVFVRRWNEALKPWYVGKTTRRTLREEMFAPHKIGKLDKLRQLYSRGGVEVFLIVCENSQGAPAIRAVDKIETYYIREAYGRNPELLNDRKLPTRDWELLGVTDRNRGRRTTAASSFRNMMMGQ